MTTEINCITTKPNTTMKIEELENPPQWLLDADTNFANVEIIDGIVHWNGGVWKDGIWHNGVWKDGTWLDGVWYDGIWENGTWYGGTWQNGIWYGGTWKGGIWKAGNWLGGYWREGTWEKGFRRIVKLVPSSTPPAND